MKTHGWWCVGIWLPLLVVCSVMASRLVSPGGHDDISGFAAVHVSLLVLIVVAQIAVALLLRARYSPTHVTLALCCLHVLAALFAIIIAAIGIGQVSDPLFDRLQIASDVMLACLLFLQTFFLWRVKRAEYEWFALVAGAFGTNRNSASHTIFYNDFS